MASETIEDIVREMREKNPRNEYPAEYGYGEVPNELRDLADRIETAYRRELCEKYAGIVDEREKEIVRLRAALKPVLACDLSKFGDGFCYVDLFESVLEAKRIYNESEVKHEG